MDRDAGRIRVARYAGVIAAVAEPGLRHQQLARRAALGLLRFQGDAAPAMNAAIFVHKGMDAPRTQARSCHVDVVCVVFFLEVGVVGE